MNKKYKCPFCKKPIVEKRTEGDCTSYPEAYWVCAGPCRYTIDDLSCFEK